MEESYIKYNKTIIGIHEGVITMKKLTLFMALLMMLLTFSACTTDLNLPSPGTIEGRRDLDMNIMTTNKMIYAMVKDIVKDKHYVEYMFNTEEEQWSFEFSEDSLGNISKEDLFIYTGADFEPWMSKFLDQLDKNSVGVINASRGVKLSYYSTEVKYKDSIIKDNPYYWLNVENYKIMMLNIKNAIQEKDPKNRQYYEDNFNNALKMLEGDQKRFKDMAEASKNTLFVVQGDKLDYLLRSAGFKVLKLGELEAINKSQQKDYIDKKFKESEKAVFLYTEDNQIKRAEELLNTRMPEQRIKLSCYRGDMSYIELFRSNLQALEKIIK